MTRPAAPIRFVVVGSPGVLTASAVAALLDVAARPSAVLVDGASPATSHPALRVTVSGSLADRTARAQVPLEWLGDAPARTLYARLQRYAPDLVVVACLARRLPPELLALPRLGCLNLHPSNLPLHRGPAPMFWQLRRGLAVGGVSVHRMGPAFDTGPVLGRAPVPLPMGIDERTAEAAAARIGAVRLGRWLVSGRLPPARPQDERLASYQTHPDRAAFRIESGWSPERALRFIRGTRWRAVPYRLRSDGRDWLLSDALGLDSDAPTAARSGTEEPRGDLPVRLRLRGGVLVARGRLSTESCDSDRQC